MITIMLRQDGNELRTLEADIDFHAHILPRCDHGSNGIQISLRQLDLAAEAGVHTVCATPHFYPHQETLEMFLARRESSWSALRPHLTGNHPRILPGAEVLACAYLEKMENLNRLCLANTNLLLIEMPFARWSRDIRRTVHLLADRRDLQIVLAHAERYNPEDVFELMESGIYVQVNADILCKRLKGNPWRRMLTNGEIWAVGSDIHGVHTGYKYWKKCKRFVGQDWDSMMERLRNAI